MKSDSKWYFQHNPFTTSDYSIPESRHQFVCGNCKTTVSGLVLASAPNKDGPIKWLFCPNCRDGSVLTSNGGVYPTVPFGPDIQGVPEETQKAYNEARLCHSVNAFTACELICRKILMHVAVDKNATAGDTFQNYISYLQTQGYITGTMTPWVDLIRKHGNDANHELPIPDKSHAEGTLMFTAELLRLIYEMEFLTNRYSSSNQSVTP